MAAHVAGGVGSLRQRSSRGRSAPALARSGKYSLWGGVAAAEQAPACRPVLVLPERLPPLQNAMHA